MHYTNKMVYLSPGARLSEKLFGATTLHNAKRKEIFYKVTTFLLTYLTYFAYHDFRSRAAGLALPCLTLACLSLPYILLTMHLT